MTHLTRARLLMASAAFASFAAPAWALDGQDLLAKINAAYAAGGQIKAQSIDVSGDDVTLTGVTFSPKGVDDKGIKLDKLTLEGVTEDDDGGYSIDTVTFPEINRKEDKATIKVSDLYLSGVHVPGDPNSGDINALALYEEAHAGPATVTVDGKTVFSMEEAQGTLDVADDEQSMSFNGGMTGIKGDLSIVKDPKARDALSKLGIVTLDGDISVKGSWELPTGTIKVDEYALDFANIGKLDLGFTLSGYTLDLVKQLQETARTMQSDPKNPQAQQASGLAMLGLMQQMSFVNAKISFDDDGITKRGLDYAGEQQGTSGTQIAQMVKAMAPILLAQWKLGALQNELSAAINTYVDDPKNLVITAAPESPVPFPMIMGAGMGAPETLPQVLGVSVKANQ